ncbi:MAG: CotH kinase family protein [Bacteroidaceae bacterium]|nr:CotH kinase family protein [Bacteroidaceae bacterium]
MKHKRILLGVLTALLSTVSVLAGDPSKLIINEIQVANIDGFIDPSVNYGGWIEFYNPTDEPISMGKLYVSLDSTNLKFFKLHTSVATVPAHGFRNIWFDHYDTGNKYSASASRQVNFKLDYEGGTFYLSDTEGNLLLSQTYPPAVQRCSYARTTDGGDEWRLCSTPTPAATNAGSTFADEQLPAPEVDADACVFTTDFDVHVTIPEGATLRYTTNGQTPTLDTGETSEDGIFHVSGSSLVLRLRLFQDGFLPSAVVTRSYIYKNKDYYLPIVSVVTDRKNLFDNRIGAYTVGTNGISGQGVSYSTNKNRSWERPVNFEYLVPEGDDDGGSFLMALNQECDFEVCGGWSRNLFAPNASFRLKGGKYYLGQNYLPYPFFKEKPHIKSKGIVVRNGGNDGYARLRDAAIHQIILRSGFYADCQEYQPVHVFINGQFQFTYNLREPNNKNHAYSNYGLKDEELDQFEINGSVGYEQKTGDNTAFREWMSLATQLAASPSDDALYEQICELVDIDEYTNYMAFECYSGCSDWLTNSNNVKGYRSRNDGKFHLVVMDQDAGFSSTNMLASLAGRRSDSRYDTGRNFLIDIFLNMLQHEAFKKRFIDAFCLVDGSVFESERCQSIITAMRDEKYKAMEFEGQGSTLSSTANSLISTINNNRGSTMNNFRNYFKLKNPITLELGSNVEGATILANGQEVPTGRFKGTLQVPMVLTAKAPAGYRFVGWRKDGGGVMTPAETLFSTQTPWFYYDQGSLDGENWKAESYVTTAWSKGDAPFGYGNVGINGSADYQTTLDYGSDPNNKRPTYYFRKRFNLTRLPDDKESYVLNCYVDDGCVVYVNGHEAWRYLMAEGDVTYDQFSTTYAGTVAGQCSFTIDNQWLHKGLNTIAVEVHNTHEHSSDIYWTAELVRYTLGEDAPLSADPDLDLAAYEGTNLSKVVATYEPVSDAEQLADRALPLRVNEVSAGNSVFVNEYFKKNDWLELYNTTGTPLDVAGLYISDNLGNPLKYQIPASATVNTVVPPHGHLVIWADKQESATQLHVPFKLGNEDGEALFIVSSEEFVQNNAAFFQTHPALKDFADGFAYVAHNGDQTVGRYPDGSNDIYLLSHPTISKANSLLTTDTFLQTDKGEIQDIALRIDQQTAQPGTNMVPVGYYNLQGTFMGNDVTRLHTGIYVVRQSDGSTRKIFHRP